MENKSSFIIDTAQTIIVAAVIFFFIYWFLFRPFQVSGQSMMPTFKNGEYILTNIISLKFSSPKKGDVIVFKAPEDQDKDFIKRVIGLPGDTVMVQGGSVYVNNQKLDESAYLDPSAQTYGGAGLQEGVTKTVPENDYFVMGDNRGNSSDSRTWGFLTKGAIIGRSIFVYWPVNAMRVVKNPY
ncbi:signal peptidase I [soil metagenome]